MLDDLFYSSAPLGAQLGADAVSLHVWAPTAQNVELLLYSDARGGEAQVVQMQEGEQGVWSAMVSLQAFDLICMCIWGWPLARALPSVFVDVVVVVGMDCLMVSVVSSRNEC